MLFPRTKIYAAGLLLVVCLSWPFAYGKSEQQGYRPRCDFTKLDGIRASSTDVGGFGVTHRDYGIYRGEFGFTDREMKKLRTAPVLDVGAGLSDFVDIMAEHFGALAFAVDPFYDKYREQFDCEAQDYKNYCQQVFCERRFAQDGRRLQFEDDYFHFVVSHYVLHYFFGLLHLEQFEAEDIDEGLGFLAELIRVTHPGGRILVSGVPDPNNLEPFADDDSYFFRAPIVKADLLGEYAQAMIGFIADREEIASFRFTYFQGRSVRGNYGREVHVEENWILEIRKKESH